MDAGAKRRGKDDTAGDGAGLSGEGRHYTAISAQGLIKHMSCSLNS